MHFLIFLFQQTCNFRHGNYQTVFFYPFGSVWIRTNKPYVTDVRSSFMLLYLYVNCAQIYLILTIFVVQYDICCTVRYLLYSTICVVQYDICCTVRYVLYSTIFVVQYDICCTVRYLLYSTIFVVQYDMCWAVRGGLPTKDDISETTLSRQNLS